MKSFQNAGGRSLAAMLLVILCFGPLREQQGAGALRGHVADERGGMIVGAEVRLTGEDRVEKTVTTDAEGAYDFRGLVPGRTSYAPRPPGSRPTRSRA